MSYEDGMPAGGNSRFRGYPARMSERQQLALLLQMTSQEMVSGGGRPDSVGTQSTSRSTLQHQRGSKSRWTNKNGESPMHVAINRKDDFRVRQLLVNGYDSNAKESSETTAASSSDETAGAPDSPRSPDTGAAAPLPDQHENQQQQRPAGSVPAATPPVVEDSGAPCEMRRTPPQNKVDRSGTGQSGSSPRVTLRLNQVRSTRDEKKGAGNSRHGINAQSQGQMDATSKSSTVPSSGSTSTSSSNNGANNAPSDSGDVYEFKSSKEATPVRGASSSPNPTSDSKEKDTGGKSTVSTGNGSSTTGGNATTSVSEPTTVTNAEDTASVSASPSSVKRAFESDANEEQDEENRRKKRKDSESSKEGSNPKNVTTGRQTTGRNSTASDKCAKSGKQGSNTVSGKNNQNSSASNADRKSPSSSTTSGSSPKPSSASGSTNSKTATPAPPESDGEDDRSKSSDSSSAPKVPPLKIVIPQSTASEQEQGNRNGKNASSRSHQLPYVVASSNSNDSMDKDQGQTTSGTASPTEGGPAAKSEDKKDFTGVLHGEERSTHHQRVLRSSHRTGNGGSGLTASKETASGSTANANYSNSSPLPVTSSTDRSNNSSPQQRHHSPTPETTTSEPSKATATESTSSTAKVTAALEKSEKNNVEGNGKSQKDGAENSDNASTTSSSTTTTTSAPTPTAPVELHPRKRKMKPNKEAQQAAATAAANEAAEATNAGPEVHPHDQPITNCFQLFLNIRKQIERRRKGLFPVQPKPPQGFKDYLMNRCTYVLAGNAIKEPNVNPPVGLPGPMKDLYVEQEKERYRLRMQHVVEKEKLVLSVEQEILRVHGRAARALANQSLPFSVCTILKDEEVYNVITPEQEEKDRNARSRYNGRLFLSWLQDVDDKWEKIKEAMLLRHHNEAESLHAVQRMDWEWKLKEVGLCEFKTRPQIEDLHVPMVHVSDDFDLLPA